MARERSASRHPIRIETDARGRTKTKFTPAEWPLAHPACRASFSAAPGAGTHRTMSDLTVAGAFQLTVLELDKTVRLAEVAVVVGDYKHSLATGFQLRQKLRIKYLLEFQILVCGPLIKEVNGPVLQVRREQGQSLTLSMGKRGCRKHSILHADLTVEPKPRQVISRLGVMIRGGRPRKVFKEIKVREYRRKVLPVPLSVCVANEPTVDSDFSLVRRVEPRKKLREGGLATAVPPDQKTSSPGRRIKSMGPRTKFLSPASCA